MATVIQAYRFALDPTPRQRRALASHCGAARYAYNWGLALVKVRLDERQGDPRVQVPWSLPDLRWEWNRAKHQVAPWWADNSKEAYNSGLDGLAQALKNWAHSRNGRRKGRSVGFPSWKKKGRARDACRFTTGQIKVLPDRKHIQLPPHRHSEDPRVDKEAGSSVGAGHRPDPRRYGDQNRRPLVRFLQRRGGTPPPCRQR
jgi:putative transposase